MKTASNSRVLRTIPLLIAFCLVSVPTYAKYGGGTGEPNDPYQIATAEDLMLLGETPDDYDKHFIMTADIDLDPNLPGRKVFDKAVIGGDRETPFSGVFDGNGFAVRGVTMIGGDYDYVGLFGEIELGAEVYDLGVVDVRVVGYRSSAGGLAGSNHGDITNCYSTGTVSGTRNVGGLVGRNNGSITASYSTGTVTGDDYVGGLVGSGGNITTSYSTGAVTGNDYVGGLVGSGSTITTSYSSGTVSGDRYVGGLVGSGNPLNVQNSVWDVETSGLSVSTGGLGLTTSEMMDSYMLGLNGFANDPNWILDAGRDYPRLAWEGTVGDIIPEPEIDWMEGHGTAQQPYRIDTIDQFMFLIEKTSILWDRRFVLMTDIDLDANLPNVPVFTQAPIPVFSGFFDGNGHSISNLTIMGGDCLGLFGELGSQAMISNLGLEAVDVNGIGGSVGALVGNNNGSINNCYSSGTVSGHTSVGGLVGSNSGSISMSSSISTVSGDDTVGGLSGSNYHGSIATSYSSSTVSGKVRVGGLVGSNGEGITTTSYSTGTVSGTSSVGGLVGENSGSITTSYSTGTVTGNEDVGGLVGHSHTGNITNSYSTGVVRGSKYVGGLVGSNWYASITSSFWDIETSGQTNMCGRQLESGIGCDDSFGKTTADMQKASTFLEAGWDFVDEILNGTHDYWQISPGDYPRLRYHFGYEPVMPEGSGTDQQPYLIRDARDLGTVWFKPMAHYRLEASVDLLGITWSTAVVPWFEGTFDGNGYVISNLHIQGQECLGLFGQLDSQAMISNLGLEAVDINGTADCIGGLAGENEHGTINNCYSSGTVSGEGPVGGLVGDNNGSITTSYSTGTVSGEYRVGGLVGINTQNVIASYSSGTVSGEGPVGGLVGDNYDTITTSYSTGTVTGEWNVGGLVGRNGGSITTSYSTGSVSGNEEVGGLVGGEDPSSVTASFWDIETSGQTTSAGGIGLTTAEMQAASTFLNAGWDFVDEIENGTDDIWWIDEGQEYPRLWWELIPEN